MLDWREKILILKMLNKRGDTEDSLFYNKVSLTGHDGLDLGIIFKVID